MLQKIFYLSLAGAAGTLARHYLSTLIQKNTASQLPLGTAAVNIIGCILFGLIWAFVENKISVSGQMRTIVFVGFFGAFTTFSSFIFETNQLLNNSQWLLATGNFLLQNVLGVVAVIIGMMIGKSI